MSKIGIRVYANKDTSYALGSASITLAGQFAISGIRIVTGKYGPFLRMPSIAGEVEGANPDDVLYLVNSDERKNLTSQIIALYEKAKASENMMAETISEKAELPFDINIMPCTVDGPDKAKVTLKFMDTFYVEKLKVRYKADEDKYIVCMPSYKTKAGEWRSIAYPVTAEFREMLSTGIIESYKKTVEMNSAQL